ncbi:BON domain-containing protein (plasmid) [Agrobacterium salinitolerans]|uniref:BON domain-containing protein n=1 Tax=Agrobacterium salinitolerans TaxID=1183413 RepID=UPI001C222290|nr:BON domain-containing protein [Agrobacterium salinitolerans]QXC53057.1 BON domain-containing protein [Agrobacterium salinitolerans]
MNDNTLRQNIIDELEFEPSIDAANIGVAVDAGVATLTGHVPTYMQKASVESIVRRVKGVKGIAEEIEVRPFSANLTADDEIAKRAVSTLKWNTVVPDDAVNVQVEKGWISLRGAVEWQYQKEAAADAVRTLTGVLGVTNWIEVKPRVSVADVKKRIEDALKRNAEVEAQKIRINVADGEVVLEGKVDAWSERQAAERAAWAAPGVRSVVDHLRIF